MKSDESCISNPRSEISDWTSLNRSPICDFEISDLRWAFVRFHNFPLLVTQVCCCPLRGGEWRVKRTWLRHSLLESSYNGMVISPRQDHLYAWSLQDTAENARPLWRIHAPLGPRARQPSINIPGEMPFEDHLLSPGTNESWKK